MIRKTTSAYVTNEILVEWIEKALISYIAAVREKLDMPNESAVVLADNCNVHTLNNVKDLLAEYKIKLVILPPHTSHIFQAPHLVTFPCFKETVRTIHTSYPNGPKPDIIHKIYRALEKSTIGGTNRSVFRRAGFQIDVGANPRKIRIDVELLYKTIEDARNIIVAALQISI